MTIETLIYGTTWAKFKEKLVAPITSAFNCSIRNANLPVIWKSANLTPLPRPSRQIKEDLWPISLTPPPQPLQISERLHGQLAVSMGISTPCCWPTWRPQRCVNLNSLNWTITRVVYTFRLNSKEPPYWPDRLRRQMEVPKIIVNWITQFLQRQKERVKVGTTVSEWRSVKGGVHQGTRLNPIVFILMVKDLKVNAKTIKFIGDTTIFLIHTTERNIWWRFYARATEQSWSAENNMILNAKKKRN